MYVLALLHPKGIIIIITIGFLIMAPSLLNHWIYTTRIHTRTQCKQLDTIYLLLLLYSISWIVLIEQVRERERKKIILSLSHKQTNKIISGSNDVSRCKRMKDFLTWWSWMNEWMNSQLEFCKEKNLQKIVLSIILI